MLSRYGNTNKLIVIVLIAVVIQGISGCKTFPRYRIGGAETLQQAVQSKSKQTTNDNLRFGSILQSYLGKPYRGRSKYLQGVDCSFFVSDVYKKYNDTELPRTVADQRTMGREVPRNQIQYGDLVFFKTKGNKVSHIGIYLGDGRFIHASTSRGVIISSMREKYWSQRYAGARNIRVTASSDGN